MLSALLRLYCPILPDGMRVECVDVDWLRKMVVTDRLRPYASLPSKALDLQNDAVSLKCNIVEISESASDGAEVQSDRA